MHRRRVLTGISTVGIGGIAGCVGGSTPDMNGVRTVRPDPRVVSVETADTEYFATVHNNGYDGTVRAELWFFRDNDVADPPKSALFETDTHPDRTFDLARSSFFSADERREISITATQQRPDWDRREYGIFPIPASYGAIFENTGGSGEVEITFEFINPGQYDLTEPPAKVKTVGADEEIEVTFEVVVPAGVEYEITSEPV